MAATVVFGTTFAVASPPFTAPDEATHFQRVYLISEGRLSVPADGDPATVPRSVIHLEQKVETWWPWKQSTRARSASPMLRLFRIPLGEQRAGLEYVSRYSPIVYVPYLPAVALGRLLELGPAWLVLLARLSGLAFWVAGICLVFRLLPARHWAFCALCLLPATVFQASCVSADPATNLVAFLFTACTLREIWRPASAAPIGRREIALLVAGAVGLALIKPGYQPLVALALLIPASRFAKRGQRWWLTGVMTLATIACSGVWLFATHGVGGLTPAPFADAEEQLRWILSHPIEFASVFITTLQEKTLLYWAGFVGVLGRLDIPLPIWIYAAAPLPIAFGLLSDPDARPTPSARVRAALAALFVVGSAAIVVFVYIAWTPPGWRVIEGVQGRYFLPLAPLLLFAARADGSRAARWIRPQWAGIGALVLLVVGTNTLIRHYFA